MDLSELAEPYHIFARHVCVCRENALSKRAPLLLYLEAQCQLDSFIGRASRALTEHELDQIEAMVENSNAKNLDAPPDLYDEWNLAELEATTKVAALSCMREKLLKCIDSPDFHALLTVVTWEPHPRQAMPIITQKKINQTFAQFRIRILDTHIGALEETLYKLASQKQAHEENLEELKKDASVWSSIVGGETDEQRGVKANIRDIDALYQQTAAELETSVKTRAALYDIIATL